MKIPSMATVDKKASEYIRRKSADSNGYCKCVTCDKGGLFHWKDLDCGHFIKRDHLLTRYIETNMAPQCKKCNRFQGGREARFAEYIIKKDGIEEFNRLMNLERMVFTGSKSMLLLAENENYKQKLSSLK